MLYSAYFRRQLENCRCYQWMSDARQILHQCQSVQTACVLELIVQPNAGFIWLRLYLQDDEAGRNQAQALYAAKQARAAAGHSSLLISIGATRLDW